MEIGKVRDFRNRTAAVATPRDRAGPSGRAPAPGTVSSTCAFTEPRPQALRERRRQRTGHHSAMLIRRAEKAGRRIQRALDAEPGLAHSLRLAAVSAASLLELLEAFRQDWIDAPVDRLQSMRNQSVSLADAACRARDDVAIALGIALEYRAGVTRRAGEAQPDFEALCRETTAELERIAGSDMLATSQPRPVDKPPLVYPDAEMEGREPVVANRHTGIFHALDSPAADRIAPANRVLYASAEAAVLGGFRPSRMRGLSGKG